MYQAPNVPIIEHSVPNTTVPTRRTTAQLSLHHYYQMHVTMKDEDELEASSKMSLKWKLYFSAGTKSLQPLEDFLAVRFFYEYTKSLLHRYRRLGFDPSFGPSSQHQLSFLDLAVWWYLWIEERQRCLAWIYLIEPIYLPCWFIYARSCNCYRFLGGATHELTPLPRGRSGEGGGEGGGVIGGPWLAHRGDPAAPGFQENLWLRDKLQCWSLEIGLRIWDTYSDYLLVQIAKDIVGKKGQSCK